VVLECVPEEIAEEITQRLSIPTIGIGAGIHCDGQVLVVHDLLGLLGDFRPRFVKRYVELGPLIVKAAKDFIREVKEGDFPTPEHVFHLEE